MLKPLPLLALAQTALQMGGKNGRDRATIMRTIGRAQCECMGGTLS